MDHDPSYLEENRQPRIYGTVIAFFVLSIFVVALRLLVRRVTNVKLWWDDWLMLCATIILVVNFVTAIEAILFGAGKHLQSRTDPSDLTNFLIWTYVNELFYPVQVTFLKSSILFLYLRIFGINKTFVKFVYALIILVVSWWIGTFLSTLFQCQPIKGAWKPTLPDIHCFNYHSWLIWTNVTNILIDAGILVLPIQQVWRLKLSVGRKISICGAFLLGIVTIVCSIVRLVYNSKVDLNDPTWSYSNSIIWSTVETNIGIFCACAPTLAPLLRLVMKPTPARSSGAEAGSNGTYERAMRPRDRKDLAKFSKLDEDASDLYSIRKTVQVDLEEGDNSVGMTTFDVRRPGDTNIRSKIEPALREYV